jgi:hypothetical protein
MLQCYPELKHIFIFGTIYYDIISKIEENNNVHFEVDRAAVSLLQA